MCFHARISVVPAQTAHPARPPIGNLAALANLNYAQLSTLMRDQIGVGPVVRAKIVHLGDVLGLSEAECFREVRCGQFPLVHPQTRRAILSVDVVTLRRAVQRDDLKAFKVNGGTRIRYRAADLDAWLESHPVGRAA